MLERMKELLRSKKLCALATASAESPHCSLMAYLADPDGTTVYLVSAKKSRKSRNLESCRNVSLLVDTRDEHDREGEVLALTVAGRLDPFAPEEADERESVRERFARLHPDLHAVLDDPDAELLRIRIASFQLLEGPDAASFAEI